MVPEVLGIAGSVIGILGSAWATIKYIVPKITPHFERQFYMHKYGVHIIRDIERQFGKEAGTAIKEILQKRAANLVIDGLRLDIIENASGLGIYICDAVGKCTYANKTLATMFGLQQKDMLGYGWTANIVDQQKAYLNWKFAVENRIPYHDTYTVEVNGKHVTYTTEAEESISDGELIGFVGIVKKVSE
jgi:PAS domain S-box-containing protein